MYFIALVLPQPLNENIFKYKQMMLEKYNCRVGLKAPAHITLVPPFWMEEEKEQQLIADIDHLGSDVHPFHISTNNFSAFKPRTIFVALTPNKHLQQLKEVTDRFFKDNSLYNIKIDARPFHPHITIATRDLFKKSFFEVWPWFAEKKLIEEWQADGISLLKHNKKNWDVIHTSQFKNL